MEKCYRHDDGKVGLQILYLRRIFDAKSQSEDLGSGQASTNNDIDGHVDLERDHHIFMKRNHFNVIPDKMTLTQTGIITLMSLIH